MPYPPGVSDVPYVDCDYWQDMSGCLDTAARNTLPPMGLRVQVDSEAGAVSSDRSEIELVMTARLSVPNYPDPSDASLEMAVALGSYWTTVAGDMLKARRT